MPNHNWDNQGSYGGYTTEPQEERPVKKKKKKDKKKRKREDDESSQSASPYDWRQEVWRRGFQSVGCWPMLASPAAYAWGASAGFPGAGGGAGGSGAGMGLSPLQQHMQRQLQQHLQPQSDWNDDWGERAPPRKKPRRGDRYKEDWQAQAEQQNDVSGISSTAILEPVSEAIVAVPRSYIAKVIGKGGSQVCVIREKSGAQIDARQQNTDPCNVKVIGTEEAIEKARDMIWDLVELASLRPGIVLDIPRAKIGKVIGIRGAQINEIQVTTGAKVDVDKDCDPCKVTIGGEPDKVEHARRVILTLAMEAADGESEYLDLPKGAAGAVLGVQGARLRELQAQSGARIDVDKTQPTVCRVRIAGDAVQIAHAKDLVLLAVETPRPRGALVPPTECETPGGTPGLPTPGTEIVKLPEGTAGKIIGRGGATIQALQAESGARIWVDCESGEARLQGKPECVEHARFLVEALLVDGASLPGMQSFGALPGEVGMPLTEGTPLMAAGLYSVCPEGNPVAAVLQASAGEDTTGIDDVEGGGGTDLDAWAAPWGTEDITATLAQQQAAEEFTSALEWEAFEHEQEEVPGSGGCFGDHSGAMEEHGDQEDENGGLHAGALDQEANMEPWGQDSSWDAPNAGWQDGAEEYQTQVKEEMPWRPPRGIQPPRRVALPGTGALGAVKEEPTDERRRLAPRHVPPPNRAPGPSQVATPRPTSTLQRAFATLGGKPTSAAQDKAQMPAAPAYAPRPPMLVRGKRP